MDVTFFGVRGSTPCAGESTARYGGNTSCVVLSSPGHEPILFDLGTGLRYFGQCVPAGQPLRAHALVTHLHWDHVQGLPFCPPLLSGGSQSHADTSADSGNPLGALGLLVDPGGMSSSSRTSYTADSVKASVLAAFHAGANGVIFARNWGEMNPDHVAGIGAAVRELGIS